MKMTNKIENKIIEYIKIIYEIHNREIDITEIRFSNTEFNKYTMYYEYEYMVENETYTVDDGEIFLDLEKITFFDDVIDWSKNQFCTWKPNKY